MLLELIRNINHKSYTQSTQSHTSIAMAPLKVGDSLPEGVKFEYVPLL
jgi:hypothetical protein